MSERDRAKRDGMAGRIDALVAASPGRRIFLALGWVFFVLGAAGAVLPVLPTTPFMILALWSFSRGSTRLHDWLYNHPIFGPRLQGWHRHRTIPRRVKLSAYAAMAASFAYVALLTPAQPVILTAVAALMLVGVVYIARCPNQPPLEGSSGQTTEASRPDDRAD